MEQTNPYLLDFEWFEKETVATTGPALHRLRNAAVARFTELGFPGPRDEEWRFTPAAPLANAPFRLAPHAGRPAPETGGRPLPDGVIGGSLAEALQKHPQLVEPHLARYADYKRHPFVALNTAFLRDGAFVYVPAGRVVEAPIILPSAAAASGEDGAHVWHRRCLIVLGANAKATVAETFNGRPNQTYFTNAVTEVVVGDNAELDHYKVQEEGDAAGHMAVTQVQVGRSARFASHAVLLGGAWTRNEVNAVFAGPGGECTLNGLYRGDGRRFVGNHTLIDHAHPHCASHELYKGVLGGKARGVFNGKIFVRQDAQKTDAKQTNKTLLLSEDATINSKPQLEIYADDVKCTHGATVGQLDEEATFYLRSRGVGVAEARALLTYAFANDIIDRIRVESIRDRLRQAFLSAHGLPAAESEDET
jgi:Fe-S cluster assembly protein SufD